MEITEVKIKLMSNNGDRLQAFCSITLDNEFVVRDLKVIEGQRGLFVAMPSRKLTRRCNSCSGKIEVRAMFCTHCGDRQPDDHLAADTRTRVFADIAHPINAACRQKIQRAVIEALEAERRAAQQPGYVCRYDDFDEA